MEGLIPMVYRSIKKSKTFRRYESLSSAAKSYNIEDFYPNGYNHKYVITNTPPPPLPPAEKAAHVHHRRYNSFGDYSGGGYVPPEADKPKKLVRFRSHRMFSCVTGA